MPYSEFSFETALESISRAGYKYVGFGTNHQGKAFPDPNAEASEVRELANSIENYGLAPIMMFNLGGVSTPEALDLYKRLLDQAKAMEVPLVLSIGTWGYKQGLEVRKSKEDLAVENEKFYEGMRKAGEYAADIGITIVLKPHTGCTATSRELLETMRRINLPSVRVCYDCGNVHFYEGVDPIEDIVNVIDYMDALCIKDHRGGRANPDFPVPGDGDIDHNALFKVLSESGFSGPCLVERVDGRGPKKDMTKEEIDARIKKAFNYLSGVTGKYY